MEEERLRQFAWHCRTFYDSSLILSSSSSSLSSMKEEKTEDEATVAVNDTKRRAADGRAVIEELDRIVSLRSLCSSLRRLSPSQRNVMTAMQGSLAELRRDHGLAAERRRAILHNCGLLDLFADVSSAAQDEDETGRLLKKYTETRDRMRRQAHKLSMRHRQNSVLELLSQSEPTFDSCALSAPRMTRLKHVQSVLSVIQTFVKKYRSNIGSHPFLAGLHRAADLQLHPPPGGKWSGGDPSYVVRWKFLGSVLTEACRSFGANEDQNVDDELVYARDAIEVLFSFMVWVKDADEEKDAEAPTGRNDAECDPAPGSAERCGERPESFLCFEVDKHLSDANLRRILAALPRPERLEARATGAVEIIDGSEGHAARNNVDGVDDEQWPWFARIQFCNLL